jgi:hypothetical protein
LFSVTIVLVADGSSIFARTFIHFIVGWVESSRSVSADTILTISLNTWSCFTVVEKETERQFEDTKVVIRNCKIKRQTIQYRKLGLWLRSITALSTIFQLYRGSQFYW